MPIKETDAIFSLLFCVYRNAWIDSWIISTISSRVSGSAEHPHITKPGQASRWTPGIIHAELWSSSLLSIWHLVAVLTVTPDMLAYLISRLTGTRGSEVRKPEQWQEPDPPSLIRNGSWSRREVGSAFFGAVAGGRWEGCALHFLLETSLYCI